MNERARPWSHPIAVDEIPETGRHVELVADESVRAAIAALAGVEAVPVLTARFDLARFGRAGLCVTGTVSAEVDQTCVVTLEPMRSKVEEPVDVTFTSGGGDAELKRVEVPVEGEGPEPLIGGGVDLGGLATEFLLLAIDPYPRKPGAVFEAPAVAEDPESHPFAALAALKGEKPAGSG